jgi:2-phosphoxylose phosphatase
MSSPGWNTHLTAASSLYSTLDDISGVSPNDSGFHISFDHYYDNLSARQCHAKPLPCKVVNGMNSTTCVTQEIADEVYRFGNWEYSYIYRDSPKSLNAAVGQFGVWIAELATHIRDLISGRSNIIYWHNIAHDGSVSRLLSFLQIDVMVWPGMGSEVVFEVYQKTSPAKPSSIASNCNRDNCLRQFIQESSKVSSFCPTFTSSATSSENLALPTFVSECSNSPSRVSSACSCIVTPTSTAIAASSPTTSPSEYYMRVLWGGKVLRSSNPTLGLMDMVPLERVLAYFDGLVGVGASLVQGKCNGTLPY